MAGADTHSIFYRLNSGKGQATFGCLRADPALYEKVPTADLEEATGLPTGRSA